MTHCPLPATAQGPEGIVESSLVFLLPAGFSGTRRTFADISRHTAPCLPMLRYQQDLCCGLGIPCPQLAAHTDPQDLCCCLKTHCPLPVAAQEHTGTVVSSQHPVSPACGCSATCRTCSVVSGTTCICLQLLRDLQDLWCFLGTQGPLTATAQGPARPVLFSVDSLPPT